MSDENLDGGLPGGAPAQVPCNLGPCPTCSSERQQSSPCTLLLGHDGDHVCAFQDAWSQASASDVPIPKPPPVPKCRMVCPQDNTTCMLVLGHDGAHQCGHSF
ncbi:hypothetical protein [Streptomyces sp. NPDC047315]|uniref:hypothetical protein n=1 Tax=Streptomyces sp. NPDC047315 TaxID=3155142 RepID=UPI003405F7EE